MATLSALAANIDASCFTEGHSEKVTEYALGICEELGFNQDFKEVIRVAALLHDYGKIGVNKSILKKAGKLTEEEFEEVKSHAGKTKKMLEEIQLEEKYRQVPEIAGYHHEKMDGTGYPLGLKGDEIPLGARVIAVADFFEAITSKRPYRNPMDLNMAFALLEDCSGRQFDPDVVEAFCRYYGKRYGRVSLRRIPLCSAGEGMDHMEQPKM